MSSKSLEKCEISAQNTWKNVKFHLFLQLNLKPASHDRFEKKNK